ncbi:unconventional myosin-XV-like [Uranotaenia lowii]|uniref:unconventional myosin-XV-like n=1 Tax=Uranotaenia lowii TaxID=190385 RepID=UPI0024789BD3|nr:unconventional myosin-XV-like [Uranotaenia lowii]
MANYSDNDSVLDEKLDKGFEQCDLYGNRKASGGFRETSYADERLSDSEITKEICEITGKTHEDFHRASDLEDAQNVLPMDVPIIKAYLEKFHEECLFENCGFKKEKYSEKDSFDDNSLKTSFKTEVHLDLQNPSHNIKNKKNLPNSGSVGRMETILEEPVEPKISVKEILARFETLKEAPQTKSTGLVISSGARAAAAVLNVPIERLEANTNVNSYENHSKVDKLNQPHSHELMSENGNNTDDNNSISPEVDGTVIKSSSYMSADPPVNHQQDDQHIQSKHPLLQFAIQHFRNESPGVLSHSACMELVQWQIFPSRIPLLRLPAELTQLAVECFDCILRYCGDIATVSDVTEVKCVYTILMHCHKHLTLRDEVYCQLIKQSTANHSPCPDSAQRVWRLLSILTAYFGCSDALRPYLFDHLSSAASDRRRQYHGTAAVCLANLRKTARCGGRKNVPSVEEVTAVSAGRSARRQVYRLPGGAERVVNTRCSTVVGDVITDLCSSLGIESPAEQQEFSLYCIVQGDAFTMPLAADEYILDVTTELLKSSQPFYLIFCRSVWHFPLKRDPAPTSLYIEVLFNQVAPDYLEGLLLELPNGGAPTPDYVRDMARIAAILHRAADLNHLPAMKEIKFLLPKPALSLRELRPAQWVALVQSAWPSTASLSPIQVKAQFLNVLSSWPLFGSSFFAVKRVWSDDSPVEDVGPMWRELILALNRRGVLFLDPNTHETMQHWPFNEVISTRKVRSEDGALFLDMKVGNLLQQRVIRVQTEQAHEISRLVRQYINMAQAQLRDRKE